MDAPTTFDHPSALHQYATSLPPNTQAPLHLRLNLLNALQDPALLVLARRPLSRYMRDGDGNRLDSRTNNEYLGLEEVGKAWRVAMTLLPAAAIRTVVFDVSSLPTLQVPDDDGVSHTMPLHWETNLPGAGGVAIMSMQVFCLVTTIATVAKLRGGGRATFRAVYNADARRLPAGGSVEQLHELLRRLSAAAAEP